MSGRDDQVLVRRARLDDVGEWVDLRAALWPGHAIEGHRAEVMTFWSAGRRQAGFLARLPGGEAVGFAEASVRVDYVNGSTTSPVGFLEGIYVVPPHRMKGVARALSAAVADWARSCGCAELASDAGLENEQSHAMHRSLGFSETQRVVFFIKPI